MRSRARVIVVGEGVPLEPGLERLGVRDARAWTPSEPTLVILGDEALMRLEPVWLLSIRKAAVQVLVATRDCPGSRLAAWVRAGARDVTDVDALPAEVERRMHRGIGARRRLDPPEWCVRLPRPGSPLDGALHLVSDIEAAHRVGAWATLAGYNRQFLWVLCRDEVGAAPRDVLRWHVAAQVKQATERGFTIAAIATELGFSSPSSLSHALGHRPP